MICCKRKYQFIFPIGFFLQFFELKSTGLFLVYIRGLTIETNLHIRLGFFVSATVYYRLQNIFKIRIFLETTDFWFSGNMKSVYSLNNESRMMKNRNPIKSKINFRNRFIY